MSDWAARWLGRLFGRENLTHIDRADLSFGAAWAHDGPAWVLFALVAVGVLSFWFYLRRQTTRRGTGITLAAVRTFVLAVIVLILAEPVLELHYFDRPRPLLWLLADASDSMNLAADQDGSVSRAEQLRTLLSDPDGPIRDLSERFRLRAFVFDRPEGARPLDLNALTAASDRDDAGEASQAASGGYSASGSATALGATLEDLRRRYSAQDLSGVVIFSDFVQNAGPSALEAASSLNVPVFAVGLGPTAAADLAVDLDAEPTVKKAERVTFSAILRQSGLTGNTVALRLSAAPADGSAPSRLVAEREVLLDAPQSIADFAITPEDAGRYVYSLTADQLPGELVAENNSASRRVTVTDDYLRLLFVEYEPTWEWRFVKEVFHRDRLVGLRGFRTYLRSSDPTVRNTNELFLETLPPPRDEFFQYDVIFLGDLPASALPGRFTEMTREFVSQFGGGLVVMAGPRFGPQALADSEVADMLPVILDRDLGRRDEPFELVLTPAAAQFDFMQLGESEAENRSAWRNLGPLPWYQPVRRVESTAVVLAEHPTDTTADGRTKQPLIARRPYGASGGEVVYLGFNETWRLRRKYGEKYYRQFWGQLIYRLGLGHARGADKRFVIDPLPDEPFRPDEEVPFTVRAWDRNFERLTEDDVPGGALNAELVRLTFGETTEDREERLDDRASTIDQESRSSTLHPRPSPITLPMSRPGVFEARLPVYEPGDYRLRVTDPVTQEVHEARFRVADLSVERRVATRDAALQKSLAAAVPGGRAYELSEVSRLAREFDPPRRTQTTTEILSLWDTWFVFGLVTGLLLVEWLTRKAVNLA